MTSRVLGTTGPTVSALGLGAMGMSDLDAPADDAESVATIHAAIDAGVTLIDTGDFYGSGRNELLIARALKDRNRDDVAISVKFGALRDPAGGFNGNDGRPASVKNFLANTLTRLGTDHVDIYRPARVDPDVPIEETVGAIGEMVDAGFVRHVGLSEVSAETIRRAAAVRPIADVQIEYSLISRGHRGRHPAGHARAGHRHHRLRRALPRPAERPLEPPTASSPRTTSARSARASRARTSSATSRWSTRSATWPPSATRPSPRSPSPGCSRRGEDIVALVGARRRERLHEALGSLDVELSPEDLEAIDRAVPAGAAAGSRYAEPMMAELDSER